MSSELLALNYISYDTPEVLCAAKATKKTQIAADPNRYDECVGGEAIPIVMHKLPDCCYIDGSKSSISLKLRVNVPEGSQMFCYAFDTLSVDEKNTGATIINLFSQVVHETNNSQILYRENFINQMQTIREYRISKERKGFLSCVGGEVGSLGNRGVFKRPVYGCNRDTSFNIPLYLIAPFWNTAQLIPSRLLHESILTLIVNNPRLSLYAIGSNGTTNVPFPDGMTVSFSNIALNLYQSELYNGINSAIKSSELHFPYYCYNNDIYFPNSPSFTYNINLACSKLSYVALKFVKKVEATKSPIRCANVRDLGAYMNVGTETNAMDTNGLAITIVARVGGMVFPTYPITTAVDAYIHTVEAINQISYNNTEMPDPMKCQNKLMPGNVGYTDYNYSKQLQPYTIMPINGTSLGGVIFAINLEKSNIVGLSGISTNGGRVLTIEINGLSNFADLILYSQVKYMSIATMNENNIIVSK
jgi:hypothetical protein